MRTVLILTFIVFLGACDAIRNLTVKTTAEECTDIATQIVAQACKNVGEVRDKSQALVKTVEEATKAAQQ